jgi:hypothetical protein
MPESPSVTRPDSAPPSGRPPRRARWILLALAALAAALGLAAYAFVGTEAGVQFAARTLALRTGGQLEIDGATGSLLHEIRVRRIAWRGSAARVTAEDAVLTWSPAALWSRGVVVRTLGAQRLDVEFEPSDSAIPLPDSLALPFPIAIDELAVARLDWRVGRNRGTIRGLALRYAGDSAVHRFSGIRLGAERWSLTGEATIAATPPFAIGGRIAATGDAVRNAAAATVTLSGTLARRAAARAPRSSRRTLRSRRSRQCRSSPSRPMRTTSTSPRGTRRCRRRASPSPCARSPKAAALRDT